MLSAVDRASGKTIVGNAFARACLRDGSLLDFRGDTVSEQSVTGNTAVVKAEAGSLRARLLAEIVENGSVIALALSLENIGDSPVFLDDVCPFAVDRAIGGQSHLLVDSVDVFTLGHTMTSSGLVIGKQGEPHEARLARKISATDPRYSGEYILAARLSPANGLTGSATFSFDRIGEVSCGFLIDQEKGTACARAAFLGTELRAGARVRLPTLYIDAVAAPQAALDRAVERVSDIYHPPVPEKVHAGWCSWYYYYVKITEQDIIDNLKLIADNRDRYPYDYIQIDDGYQLHWGDWLLPSSKFPHDMKYLSGEIKRLGFKPGIWVSPMIMTVQSNLFRDHPDWAVKDFETGEPVQMKGWSPLEENPWVILDGSNPEFLDHLRNMFGVMAHDWGYEYFKLDALMHGAAPGKRYDPTCTPHKALRNAMQAIRDGVGPNKYILGCTPSFGAMVGIVNGERVSGDVSTAFLSKDYGCSMEKALPQSIWRSFVHGKWWHNDPDCVLTRAQGTPLNEKLSEKGLSLEEARFFVTVVGLTQGIQMIGENMMALDEERRQLLDAILPIPKEPAQPADIFESPPTQMHLRTPHGLLVALLNWTEEPADIALSLTDLEMAGTDAQAVELWTRNYIGSQDGVMQAVEVPAHGSRVLLIREKLDRPMFLGFSGHITCGADLLNDESWDAPAQTLKLNIDANCAGTVVVRAPEHLTVATDAGWTSMGNGLWTKAVEKGAQELSCAFS